MGLLDDAIREHLDLKRRHGADPAEVERLEREVLGPVRRDPLAPEQTVADRPSDDAHTFFDQHDLDEHPETAADGFDQPDLNPFDEHPTTLTERAEEADAFEPEEDAPRRRGLLGRRGRHHEVDPDRPQENVPPRYQAPEFHEEHLAEDDHLAFADEPPQASGPSPVGVSDDELALPEEDKFFDEHAAPEGHLSGETVEYDVTTAFEEEEISFMDHVAPRRDPAPAPREKPPAARDAPPPNAPPPGAPSTGGDVLEETPEFLQDTPDHDRLWFEQRPPKDFDFDK